MQLFAGLGNPGPEYAMNRHNIGFMAVDVIHEVYGFSPWKRNFQGLVSEGRMDTDEKIILLKPTTFMNESGRSVAQAMHFYKLALENLTVFHDDLDLAPFRVKVKRGGGAGGQKGLRSIDRHLGQDYRRVRIGIGHPGDKARVVKYVLGNWPKPEHQPLLELLADIADYAPFLVAGEDDQFMNRLALRQQA